MSRANIASRLKELRTQEGMTKTDLARATGISRAYLSEIESGLKTEIGISILVSLADIFGVTLDYLVGRSSE